ncbi:MAG: hypothetical protein ACM3MD_10750, partial [Betaproteobacteria bacterium]
MRTYFLPNSKSQITNNIQSPNYNNQTFGTWRLVIGAYLLFVACYLVLDYFTIAPVFADVTTFAYRA